MKTHPRPDTSKGFALILTISLTILLVVVAVGLLTLSTISQRTTFHGEGRARAQAIVSPQAPLVSAVGNEIGNLPSNTPDGSLATRWAQFGLRQWIRFELPGVTTLDRVEIAFYKGNDRLPMLDVQPSTDGTKGPTVFRGQSIGTNLNSETFSFAPQPARFMRYTGNGTSIVGYNWNSLTEVSIPLPAQAGTDPHGLPDEWEVHHLGAIGQSLTADTNGDAVPLGDDYILGNNPTVSGTLLLRVTTAETGEPQLMLFARAAFAHGYVGKVRKFRLRISATPEYADWNVVPAHESIIGNNHPHTLPIPQIGTRRFYMAPHGWNKSIAFFEAGRSC